MTELGSRNSHTTLFLVSPYQQSCWRRKLARIALLPVGCDATGTHGSLVPGSRSIANSGMDCP